MQPLKSFTLLGWPSEVWLPWLRTTQLEVISSGTHWLWLFVILWHPFLQLLLFFLFWVSQKREVIIYFKTWHHYSIYYVNKFYKHCILNTTEITVTMLDIIGILYNIALLDITEAIYNITYLRVMKICYSIILSF